MIAVRQPPEPEEPWDRYRLVKAMLIALVLEAALIAAGIGLYRACTYTGS